MTQTVKRHWQADPAQRDAALALANRRRSAVAAKRQEINSLPTRAGCQLLAHVLLCPTEEEASGRVRHWLIAPNGIGETKVDRLLNEMRIMPNRRLRQLTPRQVNVLALAVTNAYRTVPTNRYGEIL